MPRVVFSDFSPKIITWEGMKKISEQWNAISKIFDEEWFSKHQRYICTFDMGYISDDITGDYRIKFSGYNVNIRISRSHIEFVVGDNYEYNNTVVKYYDQKDMKYQKLKKRILKLEERNAKIDIEMNDQYPLESKVIYI